MPRRFAPSLLVLLACAPKPPADTDSGASTQSSADGDSDGATGTASTIGPTSTIGSTSADLTSTTGSGPATSTGSTTDVDPPGEAVRVHVVDMRPSEASGVDGLPRWVPDPLAEWCEPDMAGCGGVPSLGEPRWFVDGSFADVDAIQLGSRVAVLVPYEHPGCALACGWAVTAVHDEIEGSAGGGNLPADLPCGTSTSGVWLALDFGAIVRSGEHGAALRLDDRCAVGSEAWSMTFEL